jgi:hypothetical protein
MYEMDSKEIVVKVLGIAGFMLIFRTKKEHNFSATGISKFSCLKTKQN